MRSLEECKAEIFRRSEITIKKRKQMRNRILAVCLPLCLCIGAVFLWQPSMQHKAGKAENSYEMLSAAMDSPDKSYSLQDNISMENVCDTALPVEGEGMELYAAKVSVSGLKSSQFIENSGQTQHSPKEQFQYLYDLFVQENGSQVFEDFVITDPSETLKDHPKAPEYTITFTMSDQSEITFLLTGNILSVKDTDKTITLTPEQKQKLYEIFFDGVSP